jgi:hypothetical protein
MENSDMDYSRMHIFVTETLVGNTVPTYWLLFACSINQQAEKKIEMKGTVYPFRKGICIVSVNPLLWA